MTQQSLAQAFICQMAAWGVKTVFGITGNDILPLMDVMAKEQSIRYVGAAHETGAAFMASYHGKLTGELGVCISSAAGAVNLAQGLADAYMDGAPVLAITGQVGTPKIGTAAKQYFHQQDLMQNFAAYSELVTDALTGERLLIRAMSQAMQRRTVCHLSVPENLWSQPVQAVPGSRPALAIASGSSGYLMGDLERVVGLMLNARRPIVLVGNSGRGFGQEIRQLVNAWGAAVVVAQEAKGAVSDHWPEVVGGIGEAWLPSMIQESDCLLLIGSASYEEHYLPKAAIIQVETQPWQVNEIYLWDSLAGDVRHIIHTLTNRLHGYHIDPAWGERTTQAKNKLQQITSNGAENNDIPIHPARLMAALNKVVAEDAVITLDVGAFMHWFDCAFQASSQEILLPSRWRSMGSGLPAAVAAQLHFPERQVIALVGDGSLLMSMSELVTSVKYNLPITVIVVNNCLYGLEKDKALKQGLIPHGLDVQAPDFSQYALACGARGFTVNDPAGLEESLGEALSLQQPSVVDVKCKDVRLPNLI